jgi:3-(3-hydroxy-phenyl)propionate hydroxylase
MPIGDARYRWEFQLLPGETTDDFGTLDALRPLIAPWTGDVPPADFTLVRVTEYIFRAKIADRWRHGNVFLLGDAAHLTPPFIGQGMGAGLRDAMNLAWKLAGVLAGDLSPAALETYEKERKPHARFMIGMALSMGWAMTAGGDVGDLIRRLVVPRLHRVPGLRDKLIESRTPALPKSALVTKTRRPRQLAGTLCPNSVVADGKRLDTVLGDGFALVTTARPSASQCARLEKRGIVVHIAERGSELERWLRRGHATAAVIRPDRTVMCAGRNLGALCATVSRFRRSDVSSAPSNFASASSSLPSHGRP